MIALLVCFQMHLCLYSQLKFSHYSGLLPVYMSEWQIYDNRPIKTMIQVVHSGFWCRCIDLFISVHGDFGMKLLLYEVIRKTTKP